MTAREIVAELKKLGTESYKATLRTHGVPEPLFGVKVEDLKKYQKRIKMDYQLALDLFDTGIHDAMYLAGLIADDAKMTKKDLQKWVSKAQCGWISEYTVPWVAAQSPHGWELALEWIDSPKENIACSGWGTLRSLVSVKQDADLDLGTVKKLLQRVQKSIHSAPNDVRSVMNSFLIAVGSYVNPLSDFAIQTANKIGEVSVQLATKNCKVPFAPEYIEKAKQRGTLLKKRKSTKC
jgi:3-methyladenine DNA glycosylase AlkD